MSKTNEARLSLTRISGETKLDVGRVGKRWFNAQVQRMCADCQMLVVGKARLLRIGRWRHGDEAVTEIALTGVDERAHNHNR